MAAVAERWEHGWALAVAARSQRFHHREPGAGQAGRSREEFAWRLSANVDSHEGLPTERSRGEPTLTAYQWPSAGPTAQKWAWTASEIQRCVEGWFRDHFADARCRAHVDLRGSVARFTDPDANRRRSRTRRFGQSPLSPAAGSAATIREPMSRATWSAAVDRAARSAARRSGLIDGYACAETGQLPRPDSQHRLEPRRVPSARRRKKGGGKGRWRCHGSRHVRRPVVRRAGPSTSGTEPIDSKVAKASRRCLSERTDHGD